MNPVRFNLRYIMIYDRLPGSLSLRSIMSYCMVPGSSSRRAGARKANTDELHP